MTIIQWNARSLSYENSHKIGELFNFLNTLEETPEVICIQETWNNLGKKLIKLNGYKEPICFRREKGKQGGGVATFIKIGIDAEEIKIKHSNENVEVCIVRINGTKEKLDIVNFYAPPDSQIKTNEYQEIFRGL